MSSFNAGWYVIYTRPKYEKRIAQRLSESEVDNYLPLTRIVSQWHDRKKIIESPLFPNYVFAHLKNTKDFYKGSATDGFVRYVGFGNQIAVINHSVIDNIKIAMCGQNIEVYDQPFEPGQKLLIQEGPLAGCSCELVKYNGKTKALVRVQLLNRNLLVDVPVDIIGAIDAGYYSAIINNAV